MPDFTPTPMQHATPPPVATHWSRILYCHLLDPDDNDAQERSAKFASENRERSFGSELVSAHDAAPQRRWLVQNEVLHHDGCESLHSPLAAAAILLGIYVAMYLAVGGIVELLTPPEAAARVAVRSASTDRAT